MIHILQTEGRGRAEDSSYTVVDVKDSGVAEKEYVNEYRRDMMNKAIEKIGNLKQAEYDKEARSSKALWSRNPVTILTCLLLSPDPGVPDAGYHGVQGEKHGEETGGHKK